MDGGSWEIGKWGVSMQGLTKSADVDDAVAALGDPTGGRGANGQITRELERGGRGEDVLQSAV